MRRERFLIDCDEVLADFQTPVLQFVSEITGEPLMTPNDFDRWDVLEDLSDEHRAEVRRRVDESGFCNSMAVRDGSQDFIQKLQELVDVYVVTSPWHSANWMWERTNWLMREFGFTKKQIVHTSAKYLCKGDYLMDDNPEHIGAWMKEFPDGLPLLYHIPNTRNIHIPGAVRIYDWDSVLTLVRWRNGK